MTFEWDEQKASTNFRKHAISFEEAKTVFIDEYAKLIKDPDHSQEREDRFLLLGMSSNIRLLIVVHCIIENDNIRIISARKATKNESLQYQGKVL